MLGQLLNPEILVSLAALAALEIVLGIDNIVFIAIMVQRLPEATRKVAYRLGLGAALSTRLLLLFTLKWIVGLTTPLFTILRQEISVRSEDRPKPASFTGVLVQIMIIDIVFSLDSVITAVGIAQQLWVMATAMVLAVLVMMLFAQAVGDFVTRHPSMQILALSFLLLIGVLLVAEGFDQHVSKGYIYFAMGFSIFAELANMRRRAKAKAEGRVAPSVRGS